MWQEAASCQQSNVGRRAISAVGPDRARGVVPIEQLAELVAIVSGGVGDGEGADEAVAAVDAEMVLVNGRPG